MGLVLEFLFLLFGLIALFTGRLPSFLFGGGDYEIEGPPIRVLGLILPIPLMIGLLGPMLIRDTSDIGMVVAAEIVALVTVSIIGLVVVHNVRRPKVKREDAAPATSDSIAEAEINQKSKSAMIMALVALIGFPAIVFGPWAAIRAGNTLNRIKQTQVGERYRTRTMAALILAVLAILGWVVLPTFLFIGFSNGWIR